jgi:Na+/H+ antiporter NhaD/arsenite permease-like protein
MSVNQSDLSLVATTNAIEGWDFLEDFVGQEAAAAITTTLDIIVFGIIAYIVVIQLIRLLNNFNNRNAEDGKTRQEARENIKASAFIILMVGVVGSVGFSALTFFVFQRTDSFSELMSIALKSL